MQNSELLSGLRSLLINLEMEGFENLSEEELQELQELDQVSQRFSQEMESLERQRDEG